MNKKKEEKKKVKKPKAILHGGKERNHIGVCAVCRAKSNRDHGGGSARRPQKRQLPRARLLRFFPTAQLSLADILVMSVSVLGALSVRNSIVTRAHILLYKSHAGIFRARMWFTFFFFSVGKIWLMPDIDSWWTRNEDVAPEMLNVGTPCDIASSDAIPSSSA